MLIDTGDLNVSTKSTTLQKGLFEAIREKIIRKLWPLGAKLPSTRKLAEELNVSRNTVIATYDQLVAEGYINSRKGAGYYVSVKLPEYSFEIHQRPNHIEPELDTDINRSFAPGVPDLTAFPIKRWQQLLSSNSSRLALLGSQNMQGNKALRIALSDYLATSRSVRCHPEDIIITSGAQQAIAICLMALFSNVDELLIEVPGYAQLMGAAQSLNVKTKSITVSPFTGLEISQIKTSRAKAVYLTPSNQYPMGTSLDISQRLELLDWAHDNDSWIIEDDYDSEFQYENRPYPSLQGLSSETGQESRVIYIGSFSKVMFNSLRIGYMVIPSHLSARFVALKGALTGETNAVFQAALADFIVEGDLIRHIRKMRRLYKTKYEQMRKSIENHFEDKVEVISNPAGLHISLRWWHGPTEKEVADQAQRSGIIVRPMSYYEPAEAQQRDWQSIVLGFGNTKIENIDKLIGQIANCVNSNLRKAITEKNLV